MTRGMVWIANPSPYRTFIYNTSPVRLAHLHSLNSIRSANIAFKDFFKYFDFLIKILKHLLSKVNCFSKTSIKLNWISFYYDIN